MVPPKIKLNLDCVHTKVTKMIFKNLVFRWLFTHFKNISDYFNVADDQVNSC